MPMEILRRSGFVAASTRGNGTLCMIELDGAQNEAGGQVLRSALALAICTCQPFRITNIRVSRDMPGLLRQHLAAVNAAADIANADVLGAQLGSRELIFRPRQYHGGSYEFAVGASGSCSLILQTVLPALLIAPKPSTVRITGSTHCNNAPAFDCLQRAFAPLLERMGARVQLSLIGYGFQPQGGGGMQAEIAPSQLMPITLHERGARVSHFAESHVAGLPMDVAQRELAAIGRQLHWPSQQLHVRSLPTTVSKGNVITITLAYQQVTEVFTAIGEPGVRAETVALAVAQEAEHYLAGSAPVGTYLADQLLLPLALSGGGSFTATLLSAHFRSNAIVIEQFTGRRILTEPCAGAYRVTVV
jgi:RNA 3'-terminal phosphate cyclase (ATP)